MQSRSDLRKQLRARRMQLTPQQRSQAAEQMAGQIANSQLFCNSQRIAAYLPVNGEVDPTPLIEIAWSLRKKIYLPVLTPSYDGKLWFIRYDANSRMVKNRFRIPEPVAGQRQRIRSTALDLVLTPLVGFDNQGNRLGMGGGFYDRTFAFLNRRKHLKKPCLLGLAYENQRVEKLKNEPWDVKLHGVATEAGFFKY
jgi:5-formyltetrahydrofolate cyclo-ligase